MKKPQTGKKGHENQEVSKSFWLKTNQIRKNFPSKEDHQYGYAYK
jgi:hypothetical protein